MKITEIFYSLQGEGFLAGMPGVFVRIAGCPLRCRWCDTKYAWDKTAGTDYSIEEIVETVEKFDAGFVVITGGEPMVSPSLAELTKQLNARKKHITIETAGIVFVPDLSCDLMSISPKLGNSTPPEPALAKAHENLRLNLPALSALISNHNYQLKFVVDSEDDLPEIAQTLGKIGNVDTKKVMLMPQAVTRQQLLDKSPLVAELCKTAGYAFSQRLQTLLWNNKKGC